MPGCVSGEYIDFEITKRKITQRMYWSTQRGARTIWPQAAAIKTCVIHAP